METIYTSLAKTYIPDWGLRQAYRELIQNCIDNKGTVSYSNDKLTLTNPGVVLPRSVLFMGVTDKLGDETKIGQHGEGLKLALLVLARENIPVKFLTGGEVWEPCIKTNKYDVEVLAVDFDSLKDAPKRTKVVVQVPSHFDLESLYLGLNSGRMNYKADILLPDYPGKLFVKGLYVCQIDSNYGYNINSLELNRERSTVNTYALQRKIKTLWEAMVNQDILWGNTLAEMLYTGRKLECEAFAYTITTRVIQQACARLFLWKHPNQTAVAQGGFCGGSGRAVSASFASGLGDAYLQKMAPTTAEKLWWDAYSEQLDKTARKALKHLLKDKLGS